MSQRLRRGRSVLGVVLSLALLLSLATAVYGAGLPTQPGANGLERAIAAQESVTPGLLAIPGVVGTAVGLGHGNSPVVKVYTANASVSGIPASVGGFPVIVEAVGLISAQPNPCGGPPWQRPPECSGGEDPTARFDRPVPIGVSTGHPDITAGTIGACVTDGSDVYALSNTHVYADENLASTGDNVLQPGTYDGGQDPGDAIGTLHAFVNIKFDGSENRVDAAIALSSASELGTSTPSDGYGTPASTVVTAGVNMEVKKYGRTTGQTNGRVDAINATVNVGYDSGTALYTGQVIIKASGGGSFSSGGDSGSLIVTATGNNPVALLFAGNNTITVGNPVGEVLAAFNVAFTCGGATPTTTITTAPTTTTTAPTTTTTAPTTTTTAPTTTTTVPAGDVVVFGIAPNWMFSGTTELGATITGQGFAQGATVIFSGGNGPAPLAANVNVIDANTATLDIVTKDGGPPRDRLWDVTVTNPDGASGTASDALKIVP